MILVDFFCKSHYTYISVNVKDTEPDVTENVLSCDFTEEAVRMASFDTHII